jgi:hypothetical protein
MIITEEIIIKGKVFIHNYSSLGEYIERDGQKYVEAIDLPGMGHVYFETGELIPTEE